MKRKSIASTAILLLAASLLFLPSCGILRFVESLFSGDPQSISGSLSGSGDPLDPADFEPTPAPTDWTTPGLTIVHVAADPVDAGDVPVRIVDLPANTQEALIQALPDGGCLAAAQIPVDEEDTGSNPSYVLQVVRFGADGEAQWEKRYESHVFQGYVVSLCVLPDDGFAAALRILEVEGDSSDVSDRLMRFSPEGDVLWMSGDPSLPAGSLDRLFAMDDGRLLAAGTVGTFDGSGTQTGNHVGILCFGTDGQISVRRTAGTTGHDSLIDAAYAPASGLALVLWSQLPDSSGSAGAFRNVTTVIHYDDHLEPDWNFKPSDEETVFEIRPLPDNTGFLTLGSVLLGQPSESGIDRRSVVMRIDAGARVWSHTVRKDFYNLHCAARLEDGRFIVGIHTIDPDSKEISDLVVLSDAGAQSSVIEGLPGLVNQVVPTSDGGFTAIFVQTVRALPQPPYISSLWTDTEAIVSHYDDTLVVNWRRTIDRFKRSTQRDIILPTADGRLLAG